MAQICKRGNHYIECTISLHNTRCGRGVGMREAGRARIRPHGKGFYNGHKSEFVAQVREMVEVGYELPITKAEFRRYVAARARGQTPSAAFSSSRSGQAIQANTAGIVAAGSTGGPVCS